jgi:hypothetical protein
MMVMMDTGGKCIGLGAMLLVCALSGCAAPTPVACPSAAVEQPKSLTPQDPLVPVLQRRIHEREKRIAELQIQLDTLKHIDIDVRTDKKINPAQ